MAELFYLQVTPAPALSSGTQGLKAGYNCYLSLFCFPLVYIYDLPVFPDYTTPLLSVLTPPSPIPAPDSIYFLVCRF